ncbi:uncharacterized protein BCR38DRAFT_418030 [Pseudomassariella vexata]|uniref:Endosomal spry domain-containing protein n=1 Tax=Pseudomassariella vexata TaxID=1141098 RepID=A0A1Y2EKF6_9PEZI|nr:uncharacterized protein BCR38DRAFT_418030 [Pseudomassariella vexata]ORY71774.1 hypothetical protein BCR38DRAFT_418030 [Pseudomassariella vexata]
MAPLLPALAASARTLLSRAVGSTNGLTDRSPSNAPSAPFGELGPLAARSLLLARDDSGQIDPSKGAINPHDINNGGIFALFALIGVGLVCGGIWFFFWAKNGGFVFKENDWDDYKTTVLRRRGPNGTLLSNATKSTKLGGGSIYKDLDDTSTEYTGAQTHSHLGTNDTASTLSGITAGASDIASREKRARKRERREREKEKKKDRKSRHGRKVGEDGALVDEEAEAEAKEAVRHYRHERPARVGGLNKESEGSQWDGSNPSNSTSAGSDLLSNRQSTPTNTPTKEKSGGIRKVYSTADRNASRENERMRAEARRLQAKDRAVGRRDFSYQRAESYQGRGGHGTIEEESDIGKSEMTGSGYLLGEGDTTSDVGTKSYTHHIPGLSSVSSSAGGTDVKDYAEERRKKRGAERGYRRGQ